MTLDIKKHDLEIAGVGYRVENYIKSETDTFIPRLGSGDQSESTFDLLKSRSIDDYSGGTLQRDWKDDHAIFGSENLYPIYDDGVLYPVADAEGVNNIMGKSRATAEVKTTSHQFLAIANFNGTNSVVRIASDGTVTNIALPATVSAGPGTITDLVIWNGQIWGTGNGRMFYMAITATTFTDITGGTSSFTRMAVYNGMLLGTGAGTNDVNVTLYKYTGNTTTRSISSVGKVGVNTDDYSGSLLLYQGRVILTRADGMWAYDGIRLASIDDALQNTNEQNYRFPTVLRGLLYYFMPDGLYRYNGSMIEKLYDVSEVGFPVDMCVGKNRLWILYSNSAYSGSSRYDRSMGYDYSSGGDINGRIVCFDGKAMFTYCRTSNSSKPTSPDMNRQGENDYILWFADKVYAFTYYDKTWPGLHFVASTAELTNTGTVGWKQVTSIFDADFAMIDKSLENVELVLGSDPTADESITLEYRTTGFDGNTGWQSLGTFETQSRLMLRVSSVLPDSLKFRRIQLRLSGTTSFGYGFKKLVLRYLLTPDFKWQWQFSVNAFGDHPLEPLMLNDGSQSDQPVALLRGTIYAARAAAVPVGLTDVDRLDLDGDHDATTQTIFLGDTSLLKPSGYIKLNDEIIRYTAKTATSLTGCERGELDTTATTHTDGAAVYPYYRALVRRIQSESVELGGDSRDSTPGKSKPSRLTLILQEV